MQVFRAQEEQPDSSRGGSAENASAFRIFQVDAHSTELDVLAPGADIPANRQISQEEKILRECVDKAMKSVREGVPDASENTLKAVERCIESGFTARKKANFTELAGIDRYKAQLHSHVQLPLTEPQFYEQFNLENPHGLIMHGPPGTGKSMLASSCACQANANLIVRSQILCTLGLLVTSSQCEWYLTHRFICRLSTAQN